MNGEAEKSHIKDGKGHRLNSREGGPKGAERKKENGISRGMK